MPEGMLGFCREEPILKAISYNTLMIMITQTYRVVGVVV